VTDDRADPFLQEVRRRLPDVDVVAIRPLDPTQVVPTDGEESAEVTASSMTERVYDVLVQTWVDVVGTESCPGSVELQWFGHPAGPDQVARLQVWVRAVTETPVDVRAVAVGLSRKGWTLDTDSRDGQIRAHQSGLDVEFQSRDGRLVLMRVHTGYLSLGRLAPELVASGTSTRAWRDD
jgi:hypothetical protein